MPALRPAEDVEKSDQKGEDSPVVDDTARSEYSVSSTLGKQDVLSLEDLDPVLNAKIHLVNNAIDEIGFTPYHWKLFVLNGFGYAVDSLILLLPSIVQPQADLEFNPSFSNGLIIAAYVGMLVGALFWGLSADIIGRRLAFNTSLIICSVATIIAGSSPSFPVLGLWIAVSAIGGGGNLILDTAVFLEFLPSKKQWMLTLMAAWWGVGQMVVGLIAWPYMTDFSCADVASCTKSNNMGWRYLLYTNGALVLVLSILRVTVIRLKETPKYLLASGRDEAAIEVLHSIAGKYGRRCSLTLEHLQSCGEVALAAKKNRRARFAETWLHLRGLFPTKRVGISTILIWFSWTLIGLAYPLYNVFLPYYLKSRGAQLDTSPADTWRDYAIINMSGVWGPVLAGFLCNVKVFGRRGTMVVGALVTMAFLFAYTAVRSEAENLGLNCAINFWLNVYYGTLYAYTPEVLPSAHRATGNGVAVGCNRIMGIMSALVAAYANTATSVPIFICAALFVVMALVSAIFPFEPYGRRSS